MRGYIRELRHVIETPIHYSWRLGDAEAVVNDWLGKTVAISFCGEKRCIACARKVRKLYQGGYCFPCVTTLAETDLCIVKPHECHHHLGTCRDNQFASTYCMIPHYVYLAQSSQAKVGLTRKDRQWIRWVDQGAHRAMLFAELPTRKAAGEMEMEIAKQLPDKTDWRKLVLGVTCEVELTQLAEEVRSRLPQDLRAFVLDEWTVHEFNYPVLPDSMPKAKSMDLEKQAVRGILLGVRGQYLLFEDGVFNVRKHSGLLAEVTVED